LIEETSSDSIEFSKIKNDNEELTNKINTIDEKINNLIKEKE